MKLRDKLNGKYYDEYVECKYVFDILDEVEDRVGEILNEMDTLDAEERMDVDVDAIRKLVKQLKDDLY